MAKRKSCASCCTAIHLVVCLEVQELLDFLPSAQIETFLDDFLLLALRDAMSCPRPALLPRHTQCCADS